MTRVDTACEVLRAHPLPFSAASVSALAVGDLTGNGRLDVVLRHTVDDRIALTAVADDGAVLWTHPTGLPARGSWDGGSHHCPFLCWDLDGDGRCEVALHDAGDAWGPGAPDVYAIGMPAGERLVALDGATGAVRRHCPWPAWKGRVMMTVAHLDGLDRPPSLIVCDETYGDEVVTAIDGPDLRLRWRLAQRRPGGHNVDAADLDGDGRQEVLVGGVCYRGDGSVAWEAERFGHTDMTKPAKIDPDLPGLQTWVLVENLNPGVYLLGHDGATLWHEPFRHAHFGWIGKQDHAVPGLQPHAAEDGRHEHGAAGAGMRESGHFPIFTRDGSHWCELTDAQRKAYVPVAWRGDGLTDFIDRKRHRVVRLARDGGEIDLGALPPGLRIDRNLVRYAEGDDQRESVITVDRESDCLVAVRCAAAPATGAGIAPQRSFAYRHDRSQTASGYYLYCCHHDGWDG